MCFAHTKKNKGKWVDIPNAIIFCHSSHRSDFICKAERTDPLSDSLGLDAN